MQYADYLTASLGDMQQALAQRRVSARQLTTFALQRIADVDQPRYNAISWLFADDALAAAAASDAARQQNAPVGPLAGIPLLIKDNIEVKGWPTSAQRGCTAGYGSASGWRNPHRQNHHA